MKLRGGNEFLKLVPAEIGWSVTMEFWSTGSDDPDAVIAPAPAVFARRELAETEPTYDSFVVTVGELIAELVGAE